MRQKQSRPSTLGGHDGRHSDGDKAAGNCVCHPQVTTEGDSLSNGATSPVAREMRLAVALEIRYPEAATRPGLAERSPTVKVRCPFCGREHRHGWRWPGGALHVRRVAHCEGSGPRREYIITDFEQLEGGQHGN